MDAALILATYWPAETLGPPLPPVALLVASAPVSQYREVPPDQRMVNDYQVLHSYLVAWTFPECLRPLSPPAVGDRGVVPPQELFLFE